MARRRRGARQQAVIQARRENWQALLEDWRSTGLRLTEFCRQRGLHLWQCSWWKRKFEIERLVADAKERDGLPSVELARHAERKSCNRAELGTRDELARARLPAAGAAFVEAVIIEGVSASTGVRQPRQSAPGASATSVYEVVLLNGRRLMVPANFEPAVLSKLLGVLEVRG